MRSKRCLRGLILLFIVLCSCKAKEIVIHSEQTIEHIRTLTPVVLPTGTASASALLECAENGVILLSRLQVETTKNARMNLLIDSLNNLSVDAIFERDTIWLPQDSVIITKDVLRTEIEYVEKALSGWQNFRLQAGNIFMIVIVILIVIVIGYLIYKFKIK